MIKNGQFYHQKEFPCFEFMVLYIGPLYIRVVWEKNIPLVMSDENGVLMHTEEELGEIIRRHGYSETNTHVEVVG